LPPLVHWSATQAEPEHVVDTTFAVGHAAQAPLHSR
jgi:hypothetical protein